VRRAPSLCPTSSRAEIVGGYHAGVPAPSHQRGGLELSLGPSHPTTVVNFANSTLGTKLLRRVIGRYRTAFDFLPPRAMTTYFFAKGYSSRDRDGARARVRVHEHVLVPERIPLLVALVFVDVRVAKGTRNRSCQRVMVLGWSATGARSRHSTVAVTSQARERIATRIWILGHARHSAARLPRLVSSSAHG